MRRIESLSRRISKKKRRKLSTLVLTLLRKLMVETRAQVQSPNHPPPLKTLVLIVLLAVLMKVINLVNLVNLKIMRVIMRVRVLKVNMKSLNLIQKMKILDPRIVKTVLKNLLEKT